MKQTLLVGTSTFGQVYYSPRCIANVISYSELKDTAYRVWQEHDDDIFRVQIEEDGKLTYLRVNVEYAYAILMKLRV